MEKYEGTITFVNLEGGAWMLKTADGKRFALKGLDKKYRIEGAEAEIEGELISAFGIMMTGPVLKVEKAELKHPGL